MKLCKRTLAMFLVLVITATTFPVQIFATDTSDLVSYYYVTNGGTFGKNESQSGSVKIGKTITLPDSSDITRSGYSFEGWYDNVNFDGEPVTEATAEEGKELNFYAKWKRRFYTMTIPDSKQLAQNGDLLISADCDGFFPDDSIDISVSSENGWKLSKEGSSSSYSITKGGAEVENGQVFASYDTKTEGETVLKYSVDETDPDKLEGSNDILTFKVDFNYTTYRITYNTNGGEEIEAEELPAGTKLSSLEAAFKDGYEFVSWCYDKNGEEPVGADDELTENITLYASYLEVQTEKAEEYARTITAYDQQTDFEIEITTSESMTAEQVRKLFSLKNANSTDTDDDFYEVTGSGTSFTVRGKNGFTPGATYKLVLNDERLQFTSYLGEENPPVEYDFGIYKEEVVNIELDEKVRYIPIDGVFNLVVNGTAQPVTIQNLQAADLDEDNASITVNGSFKYSGNETLNPGDTVGIYEGEVPDGSKDELITADPSVTFIEILSVGEDGTITYRTADAKNVISMPEVFPVREDADTDGETDNNSLKAEESWFIYTDADETMAAMGLDSDAEVNEGDFIAFYTGGDHRDDVSTISITFYARVTSVRKEITQSGVFYVIGYENVTEEEMKASMDTNYQRPVTEEEYKEFVDEEQVLEDAVDSAVTSGFVDSAKDYLAASLMTTDAFQDTVNELGYDMAELEVTSINYQESQTMETEGSLMLDGAVNAPGNEGSVEVAVTKIEPYLSTTLQYFEGQKGLRLTLAVTVEVTLHCGDDVDMKFTITGEYQQELKYTLSVDAVAVWDFWGPIPYISDYKVTSNSDIYEYTGFGIEIDVSLEEGDGAEKEYFKKYNDLKDKVNDAKEKLENIMESAGKIIGTEDDQTLSAELPEKYAEMIEAAGDMDYVEVLSRDLAEPKFNLLYIIEVSVDFDFKLNMKINVSVGINFYYATAKRCVFTIDVFEHLVEHTMTDLEPEVYQFTFYAMGMVGIQAGIEMQIKIGLFSTSIDSVGIKTQIGAYVEFYGYFYYVYKNSKFNGVKETTSDWSGALMIEIGVYLDIAFVAQVGNSSLECEVEIYSNQWPIFTFGRQENVLDFVWDQEELEEVNMKFALRKTYLPDNIFDVWYLDLKEGAAEIEDVDGETEVTFFLGEYDYEDFDVQFTNDKFVYDKEKNCVEVKVSGDDRYLEGEMIITFTAPLAWSKNPIQRRIKFTWDNLASGYYIAFDSQGGSYIPLIEGSYNKEVVKPEDPVRAGYTFTGWYLDPECTQKTEVPDTIPAQDTVLYAGWEETEVNYTVEHYLESLSGTYELADRVEEKAVTGTTVEAAVKEYEGFTTPEVQEIEIFADGTSIARYYYSRNTYTADFILDSSEENYLTIKRYYKYGASVVAPSTGLPGYDFKGWSSSVPETMPANDLEFTAAWEPSDDTSYKVKHYLENADGKGFTLKETQLLTGTTNSFVSAEHMVYEGFTYDSALSGSTEYGVIESDGSTELSVYYRRNCCLITYEENGGTEVEDKEYRIGSTVFTPRPTRTDYAFTGWYTDEGCLNLFDGTMPDENITLYAGWILGEGYSVVHYLEDIPVPEEESTYTFKERDDLYVQEDESKDNIVAAVKEYEGFTAPETRKVDFNVEEGETPVLRYNYTRNSYKLTLQYQYDSKSEEKTLYFEEKIDEPQRTGYTFSGWYTEPEYETKWTENMPARDLTLYAKWTVNQYALKLDYNYVEGSKEKVEQSQVDYNAALNLSDPQREGYTFTGWYTDKACNTKYTGTNMPADNLIIYAGWSAVTYSITYDLNDKDDSNLNTAANAASNVTSYNIETANFTISSPKRSHYTFKGWTATITKDGGKTYTDFIGSATINPSIETGTFGDIKLKAVWEAESVIVTLNVNATENVTSNPVSTTLRYYETLPDITIPVKKGYTFKGYYENADGTGTQYYDENGKSSYTANGGHWILGNKTIYAKWEAKTFTITWNLGTYSGISGSDLITTATGVNSTTKGSYNKDVALFVATYTFADDEQVAATKDEKVSGFDDNTDDLASKKRTNITFPSAQTGVGNCRICAGYLVEDYNELYKAMYSDGGRRVYTFDSTFVNTFEQASPKITFQLVGWAETEGGEAVYECGTYSPDKLNDEFEENVTLYAVWAPYEITFSQMGNYDTATRTIRFDDNGSDAIYNMLLDPSLGDTYSYKVFNDDHGEEVSPTDSGGYWSEEYTAPLGLSTQLYNAIIHDCSTFTVTVNATAKQEDDSKAQMFIEKITKDSTTAIYTSDILNYDDKQDYSWNATATSSVTGLRAIQLRWAASGDNDDETTLYQCTITIRFNR